MYCTWEEYEIRRRDHIKLNLMSSKHCFFFMLLLFSFTSCSAAIELGESNNDNHIVYLIENDAVNQYLSIVDYDNTDYSYTLINDYLSKTDYRKDRPRELVINLPKVNVNLIDRMILLKEGNSTLLRSHVDSSYCSFNISNLKPNKDYSIYVRDSLSGGVTNDVLLYSIEAKGKLRMLSVDGQRIENIRDLGGWNSSFGGILRYGLLIRGAEIQDNQDRFISEQGISTLINDLNVSVELDFGDYSTWSPLEDKDVEFIHGSDYQIVSYVNGLASVTERKKYYNCLHLIIHRLEEGKTVYFHCNAGADRTGTLAFIIEGLLGVSESDMSKDYELTSFSDPRYRNGESYCSLVSFINEKYEGTDINEKIYNMATASLECGGLGLSVEDVSVFRKLMICQR